MVSDIRTSRRICGAQILCLMLLGSPPDMVRKASVAQDPNVRMSDSTAQSYPDTATQ